MKTKIVYIVVSNCNDTYFEQVYISLISLKEKNCSSISCLVMDSKTKLFIDNLNYKILDYVDELVVVEVPEKYAGAQCSRYLKTNLRHYISGPYLFVDTDTVISDSLNEIDELIKDTNIACVKDAHLPVHEMPTYNLIIRRAQKIGWDDIKNDDIHFNSGVMFVNDNEYTRDFYKGWHDNWLYEYSKKYYFTNTKKIIFKEKII